MHGGTYRLPLAIRSKVWFVAGQDHAFGTGLARLLRSIEVSGTLRQAASASGVSYRHAWNMIRKAESHLGRRLIIARPGGAGGGGTSLSDAGKQLLEVYTHLEHDVAAYANARFDRLMQAGEPG